jgi:cytochrome P450
LRKAARAHFKEQIEVHGSPAAPVAALLAAQFGKDEKPEDEIARTLIGVMTGFLPPTDASLRWTLYEWLEERSFWRIQHDLVSRLEAIPPAPAPEPADAPVETPEWLLRAAAIYQKAGMPVAQIQQAQQQMQVLLAALPHVEAALSEPLKRAMQKRPSPDMLWRTAVRDHRLGNVDVRDGDRVFIGIVSAMAEDANAGVTDVYPVFGGNRSEEGHPVHACPAYEFAMGTMMGILAALMKMVRVEALPAPLIVRVSDRMPCEPLQDEACDPARATEAEASPPRGQCPHRKQAPPDTGPPYPAREECS